MKTHGTDPTSDVIALGARLILNAAPTEAGSYLAAQMGIELLPGEDLIAAMARIKGVGREQMETYFLALSKGIGVNESHLLAQPIIGPSQ